MKTAKEWSKEVLQIQDACNSSGLAHTLVELMKDLSCLNSTEKRNKHPLVIVLLDKLVDLSGGVISGINYEVVHAYKWVESTSKGERPNNFDFVG